MEAPSKTVGPERVPRSQVLLITLCSLFVGFFVAAELLGAKLWEFSFGFGPQDIGLGEGAKFVATARRIVAMFVGN